MNKTSLTGGKYYIEKEGGHGRWTGNAMFCRTWPDFGIAGSHGDIIVGTMLFVTNLSGGGGMKTSPIVAILDVDEVMDRVRIKTENSIYTVGVMTESENGH